MEITVQISWSNQSCFSKDGVAKRPDAGLNPRRICKVFLGKDRKQVLASGARGFLLDHFFGLETEIFRKSHSSSGLINDILG